MEKLSKVLVRKAISIRDAMKQLSASGMQILLIVDQNNKLCGTITDGDIRRALLNNMNLNGPIGRIVNKKPKFMYADEKKGAAEFMKKYSVSYVPIVDRDGVIIDIISWKDANGSGKVKRYTKKDNIVFIPAGGKGARLDPFTKILPKPLIPINDKPIIEVVMENFRRYNFNNFVISLNYKAEMIKMYFRENPLKFDIRYVHESDFLGTAGSLRLIRNKTAKDIFVSNCDVILNANFEELLEYHVKEGNDITAVGIVRHIKIPYGVMNIKNGKLIGMVEKPEYDFIVNGGTYIIKPKVIDLIKKNEHVGMPDLILRAKDAGHKVGVYPASSDWVDIGQWEEYKKAVDHFRDAGIL